MTCKWTAIVAMALPDRGLWWCAKGQKAEAVDALLNLEKSQRLAEDVGGTRRACTAILEVRMCNQMSTIMPAAVHEEQENAIQPCGTQLFVGAAGGE